MNYENNDSSNNITLKDGKNDYKRFIAHQVNRNYRRIPADWNRLIRTYISNIRKKQRSIRPQSLSMNKKETDDDAIHTTTTSIENDDYFLKSSIDGFVPQKGDTFLHLVCSGFPSLSAVKILLDFHKNNSSNNDDGDGGDCLVGLQNIHGTTPFHVAIACCASYRVIQLLHQEYYNYYDEKKNKKKQQLCSISTKCGKLPLHIACMQHFYSGILMNHTVAELLKLMVEDFPSALYIPDDSKKYPLHLLWDHLCAPIYRHWPNFCSQQLRMYESQSSPYYSDTTLKYNRNHVWEKLRVLLRIDPPKKNNHNDSTITTTIRNTNETKTNNTNDGTHSSFHDDNCQIKKTKDIITSASKASKKKNARYENPFHILTQIPNCPPEFMDIAIHMIPQKQCQEYFHQMDDHGRLPIHYASMDCTNVRTTQFISLKIIPQQNKNNDNDPSRSSNASVAASGKVDKEAKKPQIGIGENGIHLSSVEGEERNSCMTTLLSFIPRSSDGYYKFYIDTMLDHIAWTAPQTLSVRDNETGRFPLHLALTSNKSWNDGIASIVAAYPEAVTSYDPITKLYPFMMAAVTPPPTTSTMYNIDMDNSKCNATQNSNNNETKEKKPKKQIMKDYSMLPTNKRKEDEEDTKKILTIYKLLRTYPEVINYNTIPQPSIGDKRRLSSPSSTATTREKENDVQTVFHPVQKKRRR